MRRGHGGVGRAWAPPTRRAPSEDLWARREEVVAVLLGILGFLGLVVCWWGVSGERTFEGGKDWLVGSVVASALVLLSVVYPLLLGFQRLREAKDEALSRLLSSVPALAAQFLGQGARSVVDRPGTEVGVR